MPLSVSRGEALAQFKLGFSYLEGLGVPQDHVMAHMWVNLAAAQASVEDPEFKAARDLAASEMTSEQIAEAQRLAREWKPKQ